jgi:hypothetical protein
MVGIRRAHRPAAGRARRRLVGRPRCGAPVRGLVAYRLRPRRLRPCRLRPCRSRLCGGRSVGWLRFGLRPAAGRTVRGRGAGRCPCGLLRLGLFPGAQQQAQRDQNTDRSQNTPASHGIILQATSGVGAMERPIVILHDPQRCHTLQRPAGRPITAVQTTTSASYYRTTAWLCQRFFGSLPISLDLRPFVFST